jgi:hypothetical protein
MAFERARQSLSDLEDRLRRAFGLAGPIGASLKPDLTPVLIGGDLREPGHSFNRGRSWVYHSTRFAIAGANTHLSMRVDADVLIEKLQVSSSEILTGQFIACYITVPGETPAQVITRAAGAWRDNKRSATDVPPIFDSGAAPAALGGGTAGSLSNTVAVWFGSNNGGTPNSDHPVRDMMIHLPAGSHLNWHFSSTLVLGGVGVWGRIWG